jgi:hypothetical protein
METEPGRPVTIYLSYAQKDEELKQEFEDYLVILQQNGLISDWVERLVRRGTDWSQVIDPRLLNTDIVLLLISPALVASGYCSGAEVREAFKRSETGKTRVIPILLHRVNLAGSPFEMIVCLPRTGPVSSWPDRTQAWWDIDRDIRHVIEYYARRIK